MTVNGWLQIAVFLLLILAVTKPLGVYMTRVFNRERTFMDPVLRPVERLLYRVTGVDEGHEMKWTEYAIAMLLFSVVSMVVLFLLQRLQGHLPFNPQKLGAVAGDLAFNTAASFTTNTNWQNYSGETTMSYLTQMAGLAYHNFVSAAVGIALAIAFIRGVARREQQTIGNFWVDMVRSSLWVLLPFCIVGALALVSQGVVQNLKPYDTVKLVEPQQVPKLDANGKPVLGPDGPAYFHSRPSAAGNGYDAANSAGSQLGPTNKKLIDRVASDAAQLHSENPNRPVPVDLVTTSASGLDPDITPAAAFFQLPRVAHERGTNEDGVRQLVHKHTQGRQLGILGEPRVNVLELNLELDQVFPAKKQAYLVP